MQKLDSINLWLKNSWALYAKRWPTFIAIQIFPGILITLAVLSFSLSWILGVALFLLGLVISFYAQLALIFALKDGTNASLSYQSAFKAKILAYSWVMILVSLVNTGGFLMGIIPGIIFSVWFAFAPFVFVLEDGRGLNALLKSKEYVRGYWWPAFGRLTLLTIIHLGLYSGLSMSPMDPQVISSVLSLFTGPFMVLGGFLLYQNFKVLKPEVPAMSSFSKRGFFIFAAWLPVIFLSFLPFIMGILITSIFRS